MKQKIILAYSGGLDTSVILKWLLNKGYDVVCYMANVGQAEDFEAAKQKALKLGARKVYIEDLQLEFLQDFVFKALKANALYEGRYMLGTSLARPLIAKKQVEIAIEEKASILAHGATGKGNDQVRFEMAYHTLMPEAVIFSPWKNQEFLNAFKGRSDMIRYAEQEGIPITSSLAKPYSIDENLMHTSYEAGILEDPAQKAPEELYLKTAPLSKTPAYPTEIQIEFKQGVPISVTDATQGVAHTDPLLLFNYLNKIAGENGIGRTDIVENRFVGLKSRGIYETPAGTVLWLAHRDLECLTLDREVMHLKDMWMPKVAELIYNGFWFSPEMDFLMAAIEKSQQHVEGVVSLTLFKGNVFVTGRHSSKSLYNAHAASMDVHGGFNQMDASGFIKLNALRLKNAYSKK